MKQQNEFKPEHQQQQEQATGHRMEQNTREFSSAEELLRFDAAQTGVPDGIAQRLRIASADFPKPARSWWRRLFGQ